MVAEVEREGMKSEGSGRREGGDREGGRSRGRKKEVLGFWRMIAGEKGRME
jgi:hypothetical protein